MKRISLALTIVTAVALGGCDDGDEPGPIVSTLEILSGPDATAAAASESSLTVLAATAAGDPVVGALVTATVELGGGQVTPAEVETDASGQATFSWTIGVAPVVNRLALAAGEASSSRDVTATLDTAWEPAAFGAVDDAIDCEESSTEGLVFDGEGRLTVGASEVLLLVDPTGAVSERALSGDTFTRALGMTVDHEGNLWVADINGSALRSVSPAGVVTTHLDASDGLLNPNDVRVGPDGRVYLTDTCSGLVYRYDPTSATVEDTLAFDAPTEGGPNGVAFDAAGVLYLTTETTISLCEHEGDASAPVAGLFRVPITDTGFGDRETVVANVAQFGDGLAFDSEGNLYALFDRLQGVDFESMMLVLPAGGDTLLPFLSTLDRVMANMAFGQGEYGETTMYIALLAIPPFLPGCGLNRFEVGITGLPL